MGITCLHTAAYVHIHFSFATVTNDYQVNVTLSRTSLTGSSKWGPSNVFLLSVDGRLRRPKIPFSSFAKE
ncbi:uncharacterized protein EURHEDRAFT_409164 [Aspergillus ruber CBS 135680]|uniref:Uncharacterized protein n=1 Tax=Aspergillus ruber (strain CBS 135680) TaxID=1388766 RepID=A0A017SM64_ASPRC|nr:uncharacterized protein EURHEDRAFT_409164 [Aspergillus ruber CBS 135680]EYE97881.1 hypothetical protein EURHEDRAFT_409164 [Aspergillus ruber CBS 135680]